MGFETEVGTGSTFWFEFPSIEPELSGQADVHVETVNEETNGLPTADARVLYVEDNIANVHLMERIIERMGGMELSHALDAETGLQIAEDTRPDLILLDINLPGMDGISAKKILDENPETSDIPVVAISADAMYESLERAREANFKAYLTKPFVVSNLMEVLHRELKK